MKDALSGNRASSGVIATVPNGKRWTHVDLILFNNASSAKTVTVSIKVATAGTSRDYWEREIESKGDRTFEYRQALPAGSQITVDPGTGGSVNYLLSAWEITA